MKKSKFPMNKNYRFIEPEILNNATYIDYLDRFKKLSLSIFEWVNLPKTMNARYIEQCLYFDGQCAFLKDKNYGFINTRCVGSGSINIYGLPNRLNCYSYEYNSMRSLYTGLPINSSDKMLEYMSNNECILVQNNWDRIPTCGSMELFAMRLTEAERTCDINLKAQKTPVLLLVNEKQRLMLENLYAKYDGNNPFIFGDTKQLSSDIFQAVKTDAPYVIDKISEYKKDIWNEALTFLGINNILVDKKERLISDEANSNNELINLNLQSYLAPRKEACRQFNEKFGLTDTDKAIDVRVRSDLHNIIKNMESIVTDYNNNKEEIENLKEGETNA